jgi:O-antigen/teichoic acid export membrane protein
MKKLYLKVLSQSSIYSLGSISQTVLTIILLPLYTRYLSPADFGILALMDLTILLITRLIVPPLDNALGRYYYKPEYSDKKELLLFNLMLVLVAKTALFALLYWFFSGSLVNLLFEGDAQLLYVVQIYVAILVSECISAFLLTYIRLLEVAKYFVFLSLSKLVLSTGLMVYLLTALDLGVLAVIYGQIFGACFLTVLTLPFMLREAKFQISLGVVKEPLKFGYPLVISGYSNLLLNSGDRYMLNMFSSVSSVGLYAFGYRIAALLNTILIVPLNQAIFPTIYQKEENPAEQRAFIATAATYYYFVGIFMALGLSLLAREAIMLLAAPEFWPAWTVVPIIAFSYVQLGLGRFFKWGALLRNKSYHVSAMVLASALLNIGLNFFMIPLWGILGAALATLIAYIFWNGLTLYYSAKFYSLYFNLGRIGHITVVGVALYLVSLFVANTDSFILNILIKLLLLSIYPLLFFITGFFDSKETAYIQELKTKTYDKLRVVYSRS